MVMVRKSELPTPLRAFAALGVDLSVGSSQATANCWACGKERFYVNVDTGLWDCKSCGIKGNPTTFLRQLHDAALKVTPMEWLEELAQDRKLMYVDTLRRWGVVRNPINHECLVPAYSVDGKLHQLYRYSRIIKDGHWVKALLLTPGIWSDGQAHGIFAPIGSVASLFLGKSKTHDVYVTEGCWDGMAWWETLRQVKHNGDGIELTGNHETSLTSTASVLAVPGANVFTESWAQLMGGKRVQLMFDSDHPRIMDGRTVDGAGISGMKAVSEKLAVCPEQSDIIRYLRWGVKGYDPQRPSGFDLRDWLSGSGTSPQERIGACRAILASLLPIPQEWVAGRTPASKASGKIEMEIAACETWDDLLQHWRAWSPDGWPDSGEGLDHGLAFSFASIISTEGVGDQLWGMVLGPPSSGKTTIAEALSLSKQFIYPLSTLRGIYSGIKDDSGENSDMSLILKVKNKTLIIKDGDTLMQSPNLIQILSELRDVYDRFGRTDYRTVGTRNYEGINLTILLYGTGQLHGLDHSEVGQRFLKCVVAEGVDFDEEKRIALQKARSASRNLGKMANCQPGSGEEKELVKAKQYTAGYVEYLRRAAEDLLSSVHIGDAVENTCADLGIFVACMRAQPSKQQTQVAEREYGYRLVSQLTRLTGCLSAVLNSPREVRDDIMRRVVRVALDTCRGTTLKVTKRLYEESKAGMEVDALATCTSEGRTELSHLMRYLEQVRVVESFIPVISLGIGKVRRPKWRLTDMMRGLYNSVTGMQRG